jgi:hypothetical protein
MSIVKNPYNSAKVAQIRQLLINNAQSAKPTDYEIHVDELKVVQRTNDPELFDNHEEFIDGDTKSVTIVLYDGSSRRCTKHLFALKETKSDEQSLSGIEVNKIVNDKLENHRREWKFESLVKEKQEIEEQLKEAEEYIETLQSDLEEAKSKRKMSDMQWGDIASVALEGILRRNAHLLANIPGLGGALAGVFQEGQTIPDSTKSTEEKQEATFTFKEKQDSLSEVEKRKIEFVDHIETAFQPSELEQLSEIIQLLMIHKKALVTVLQYLQKQHAQVGQQHEEQTKDTSDNNDSKKHNEAA